MRGRASNETPQIGNGTLPGQVETPEPDRVTAEDSQWTAFRRQAGAAMSTEGDQDPLSGLLLEGEDHPGAVRPGGSFSAVAPDRLGQGALHRTGHLGKVGDARIFERVGVIDQLCAGAIRSITRRKQSARSTE